MVQFQTQSTNSGAQSFIIYETQLQISFCGTFTPYIQVLLEDMLHDAALLAHGE
jgi:hypothetical protein